MRSQNEESLGVLLGALGYYHVLYGCGRKSGEAADALFSWALHDHIIVELFAIHHRYVCIAGYNDARVFDLVMTPKVEMILADGRRYIIGSVLENAGKFLVRIYPDEDKSNVASHTVPALRKLNPRPVLPA